jgi:hypothetical protein
MFVMWEMEPRKFRSDDAFRMQLARRVRRLTEANAAHTLTGARGAPRA